MKEFTLTLLLVIGVVTFAVLQGQERLDKTQATKGLPEIKAFPGAEGYGSNATGGRGGVVYTVTNLNDAGQGSLREAIDASGPRTVVFAVSGTIELQSPLSIRNNDITIAGQTAPGDGICVKNYTLFISGAENVIIRYIRSRLGVDKRFEHDAVGGRFANKVIIDHCSFSWSVDETVGNYDNYNLTFQWCLISESLHNSYHSEGAHGMGVFIGGQGISFHHNLVAHHNNRLPRLCGSRYSGEPDLEMVDMRNNVIYNWGTSSCYGGEGGDYNIVNNYYKSGPATYSGVRDRIVAPRADNSGDQQPVGTWGNFYVEGNYVHGFPNVTSDNWLGVDEVNEAEEAMIKSDVPFDAPQITPQSPQEAYEEVLNHSGASLPKRDRVDARVTEDTRRGVATYGVSRPGIIDHPDDVGGYPVLESTTPPTDTDGDGIPDNWEDANGLDKNDPEDGKIIQIDGYSNLEHYLNWLVGDFKYMLRPMEMASAVDDKTVDLTWTDLADDEDGFILERANGDGDYVEIASLDANVESYTDNSVTEYGTYNYRIKAYNAEMESAYTDGLVVEVADPDPPQYTITVQSDGSGNVIMNPDGGVYVTGTDVVLLASAAAGWEFEGWTGDVTSTDNPLSVHVDADKNITAEFSEITGVDLKETSDRVSIYPIPISEETHISFVLDEREKVAVQLYDMQGKMIHRIADGVFPAGDNLVIFDGSLVESGAYLLKFRSEKQFFRRLVVVK